MSLVDLKIMYLLPSEGKSSGPRLYKPAAKKTKHTINWWPVWARKQDLSDTSDAFDDFPIDALPLFKGNLCK